MKGVAVHAPPPALDLGKLVYRQTFLGLQRIALAKPNARSSHTVPSGRLAVAGICAERACLASTPGSSVSGMAPAAAGSPRGPCQRKNRKAKGSWLDFLSRWDWASRNNCDEPYRRRIRAIRSRQRSGPFNAQRTQAALIAASDITRALIANGLPPEFRQNSSATFRLLSVDRMGGRPGAAEQHA